MDNVYLFALALSIFVFVCNLITGIAHVVTKKDSSLQFVVASISFIVCVILLVVGFNYFAKHFMDGLVMSITVW